MRRKVLEWKKGFLAVREEETKRDRVNKRDSEEFLKVLSTALELGFAISLPIAFGAILGSFLDRFFLTSPRLTLSFIFLGVIIGGASIFKLIKEK